MLKSPWKLNNIEKVALGYAHEVGQVIDDGLYSRSYHLPTTIRTSHEYSAHFPKYSWEVVIAVKFVLLS